MQNISVTLVIIIINVIASLRAFDKPDFKFEMMLSPYAVKHRGKWQKLFTHAFIHADFMHLFFNMYVLYIFGTAVEKGEGGFVDLFGFKGYFYYTLMYIGGIVFATLPAMRKQSENQHYFALGASGAVSAIVYSFVILAPLTKLYLFFAIPMPAIVFGILYLIYESYMDKRGGSHIAHDAHFAGAIFGIVFTLCIDLKTIPANFIASIMSFF